MMQASTYIRFLLGFELLVLLSQLHHTCMVAMVSNICSNTSCELNARCLQASKSDILVFCSSVDS